ncbi:MAG TPA: organic solvent tolerance protein OstA [Treponema sp.]|nr:organic solvent tolerance protein OstA [Treponema sp.]
MIKTDFLPRVVLFAAVLTLSVPASAERITFYADNMSGTAGSTSDTTKLDGNAYVRTASMEIAADSITMSGKNFRYIDAVGNIDGKNLDTKMEFKCSRMSYDRETKIATLKDDVHLDDTENNVSADAQIIEYNQNTDTAVLQIDITLKQKDNVCNGAYAVYRKKAQMLELSGNSQIKQGEDTFRAQEITLNLDTQEITLDGRVKGSVIDDKSTKDSGKPAGGPENGAGPDAAGTKTALPPPENGGPVQDAGGGEPE